MKKIWRWLLTALAFCAVPAGAEDKPYVVLALSGGGIKGYAHIGVLRELEKEGVGIAGIVGTSMGAIVGSLYASGRTSEELERIVMDVNLGELVTASGGNYFNLSDKATRDISMIRPEIYTDVHNKVAGPLGFVAGTSVLEYIAQLLSHVTVTDFRRLPIPFAAVATDLVSGEKVVLRRGSLASAVRASMSIPGVFDPWEINGRLLVDGGMVSNMPVETAKELFPGYPVIAVNLTSELAPREKLSSVFDVVSQSITILTMQNVRREATLADLVISPGVKEYPILGASPAAEIIQQGRDAAVKALPQIRALLKKAPRRPVKEKEPVPPEPPRVMGVHVVGVPEKMGKEIERELLKVWLGRPVPMKEIVAASANIAKREDVRSVDYDLLDTERGVIVLLKVQRFPAHRYSLGGYASTYSDMGWLVIGSRRYDLFSPGDTLQSSFYLGERWGANFNYFWDMDVSRSSFWEAGLSASHFRIDASGSPLEWERYNFDVQRHFTLHDRLRLSAGVSATAVRRVEGGESANYAAPFLEATLNLMDNPDDPVNGWLLNARSMWPSETGTMLMRATLTGRRRISPRLVAELQGGFMEGDMDEKRLFSAYLGAREELYCLAEHPIEAERFAWWRAKLRYPLSQTIFGNVIAEIFGGQGYAWGSDGAEIAQPWEVGVALCAPRRLIDGKLYAVYTDRKEWRFGVSIGVPNWDVFHLF